MEAGFFEYRNFPILEKAPPISLGGFTDRIVKELVL